MSFWGKSLGTKAISVAAALGPAGGYKYLDSWGFSPDQPVEGSTRSTTSRQRRASTPCV